MYRFSFLLSLNTSIRCGLKRASVCELAGAVNTELASNTDLEVTSVESVSAAAEVSVSYTIATTDESVANAALAAVSAADPAAMTAAVNTQLNTAGIATTVTVSEISVPTQTAETTTVDLRTGTADSMANGRGAGTALAMTALFAAVAAICADH